MWDAFIYACVPDGDHDVHDDSLCGGVGSQCIYSTHMVNANDPLLQLSPVKVSAYLLSQ